MKPSIAAEFTISAPTPDAARVGCRLNGGGEASDGSQHVAQRLVRALRGARPCPGRRGHGAADGPDDRAVPAASVDERDSVDPGHVDAFDQQLHVGPHAVVDSVLALEVSEQLRAGGVGHDVPRPDRPRRMLVLYVRGHRIGVIDKERELHVVVAAPETAQGLREAA